MNTPTRSPSRAPSADEAHIECRDMRYELKDGRAVLEVKHYNNIVGLVITGFMLFMGFSMIGFGALTALADGEMSMLIGILLFGLVWCGGVASAFIGTWRNLYVTVTADMSGVEVKKPFSKRFIAWSELRDYGYAYAGGAKQKRATVYVVGHGARIEEGTSNYVLYFSNERLETIGTTRKAIGKRTPTLGFVSGDIDLADAFLDYCYNITLLEPTKLKLE